MTPESYPTATRDGLEVKLELLVHFPVSSIHASPRQQIQQSQQRHEAMVQGGLVFSNPSGTLHALHGLMCLSVHSTRPGGRGGLCKERMGLPCAGCSHFQVVLVGSRWLQQPQHMAQLSPSAMLVVLLGKCI